MANNPFDPAIIQVKKTLERGGLAGANKGFGSVRSSSPPTSRPAPGPQSLDELDDVDLVTTEPTHGDTLVYSAITGLWEPGAGGGGGGGGGVADRQWVRGSTPTAQDDEFNDYLLDPAWVRVDASGTAGRITYTESEDSLSVLHTGGDAAQQFHGLMRPYALPVGGSIQTAVRWAMFASSYPFVSFGVSDGVTYGAGNQVIAGIHMQASGAPQPTMRRFVNWNAESTSGNFAASWLGAVVHWRLTRTATGYDFYSSADGISFAKVSSMASSLVPTHFGPILTTWGGASPYMCSFEYFRVIVP